MSNEQREKALHHAIYIERLPNLEVEPFVKGWQAALSHQGRVVVPVSALEGLCSDWSDAYYFSDVSPESVRDKHVFDLRAIIEKGEV